VAALGLERVKHFVYIHLRYIVSNLKRISKFFILIPRGIIYADAHCGNSTFPTNGTLSEKVWDTALDSQSLRYFWWPTSKSSWNLCSHCCFFSLDLFFLLFVGILLQIWAFWLWLNFRNVCCIAVFSIREYSSFTDIICKVSSQYSWVGLGLTKLFEI